MKKQIFITVLLVAALGLGIWAASQAYRRLSARVDAPDAVAVAEPAAPAAEAGRDEVPPEEDGAPAEAAPAQAPDFTVTALDGTRVSLSDFAGRPRIVNFWATWCPPCRSELDAFEEACARYGGEVEFLMVDLTDGVRETEEIVTEFLDHYGYTFPVYLDTAYEAADAYGVYSIPTTVLLNADGSLAGGHIGAMSRDALFAALDALTGMSP